MTKRKKNLDEGLSIVGETRQYEEEMVGHNKVRWSQSFGHVKMGFYF